MKLIIFDLDQTLIDSIDLHNEAVLRLFKHTFGVDSRLTEIDFTGKSLMQNFAELARIKKIPEEIFIRESPTLLNEYNHIFAEVVPSDASKYVLPGVIELLEALKTDNILTLYTGDSAEVVECINKATGLGKYFRFCFFATQVKQRSDMIKLAINAAERAAGRKFNGKDVVVIGDSLRDIEAGKAYNALTIAVATGFHSEDQLRAADPDFLFKDLGNWREVIKVIESG